MGLFQLLHPLEVRPEPFPFCLLFSTILELLPGEGHGNFGGVPHLERPL